MMEFAEQFARAVLFYAMIIALFRISGKRLAGQTTTFDLIILISLAVSVQKFTSLRRHA